MYDKKSNPDTTITMNTTYTSFPNVTATAAQRNPTFLTFTMTSTPLNTPTTTPPSSALSSSSLSQIARSLPKYLTIGSIILGILILLTLVGWYFRRRKQRNRLGLGLSEREGSVGLMRRSESEEEVMKGYGWEVDEVGTPRRSAGWKRGRAVEGGIKEKPGGDVNLARTTNDESAV